MAGLKARVRDGVAAVAEQVGLSAPSFRARGMLTIATFHRVLPADLRARYPLPGLCVTPDELDWFLTFFRARYTVLPLDEAWARAQRGDRPDRPVLALTFDDGEADNFVYARPVLARHDLRASFYVASDHVDRQEPIWHDALGFALLGAQGDAADELAQALGGPVRPDTIGARLEAAKAMPPAARAKLVQAAVLRTGAHPPDWARLMTWEEIRALHAEGHEIGAHSCTHPLLPQCDDAQLERELRASKARIEAQVGAPVTTFCYPNGDADARVAAAAKDAGYDCAVTTTWGRNAPDAHPWLLARCDMNAEHVVDRTGRLSEARLALRMSGLQPGL